jgi:hypothetical protein
MAQVRGLIMNGKIEAEHEVVAGLMQKGKTQKLKVE